MLTERGKTSGASVALDTLEEQSEKVTGLLKALAHPARLLLAANLIPGERSVGELEQRLNIHQPTLSQQLGVLRSAGLVDTRREAKQVFYRLADEHTELLIKALAVIFPRL